MMLFVLIFFIIEQNYQISCEEYVNIVQQSMKEHEIESDVIDKSPEELLCVKYKDEEVQLGNILTPFEVKDTPIIEWNFNPESYYTLLMVDPDAPSRQQPIFGEFLHWSIGNIKGADLESGYEIAPYTGSGPPKGTGLHRYIFLLYEQSGKIDFDEPKLTCKTYSNRRKFSTRDFTTKYVLKDPVAGNFFQAEWDEYVPKRNTTCN